MRRVSPLVTVLLFVPALFLFAACDPPTGTPSPTQPTPTPTPTPIPSPTCQDNTRTYKIGDSPLYLRNQAHYAHLVQSGTSAEKPLVSDGVMAANQFSHVGPIVYRNDGKRFALIADTGGATYVLEYSDGAVHPNIAERIVVPLKSRWVCYSPSGKYLVTLAQNNQHAWYLLVHDTETAANAPEQFKKYLLAGEPLNPELVPSNGHGQEGFRYEVDLGNLKQEIRTWFVK